MKIKSLHHSIFLRLTPFLGEGEARAVVRLLMEHFTGYDSVFVSLHPQTEVPQNVVNEINTAVNQLLENKPIQYVLGKTVFCELPFIVTESVLIPRQETEELTHWVIKENPLARKILDIGTGSGCIAVSLAKNIPNCDVYAVDISQNALKIAQKNAELNHVKVHFMQHDIFASDFPCPTDEKFDVIVSNPPYVRQLEKDFMHRRVLDFEPQIALFVEDTNPLVFFHAILQFGQKHLADNGKLYFEINEYFGKEIINLFTTYGYTDSYIKKDIHGKERMVCTTIQNTPKPSSLP